MRPISGDKLSVVRATGQRFGCNMISAITNRGALAFIVFQGKFQNPVFVEFMKRLLRQAPGKLYLIVDGHPVHRSAVVKRFVADNGERLRLIRLPGYCPKLNPDELLNQDVKTNALGKSRPTNKAEMMAPTCAAIFIAARNNLESSRTRSSKNTSATPHD